MANPSLPPEKIELAKATFRKRPEWSIREVADFCDISFGSAHKIKQNLASDTPEEKPATKPELTEMDEVAGDSRTISLPRTRIRTLEELIEQCEIDTDVWFVERFVCNKWEMGYKDKAGAAKVEPLYQVKAFLKRNQGVFEARKVLTELLDTQKRFFAKGINVPKPKKDTGLMLELNLADVHFGKLAWSVETGGANYDLKIAERTFCRALEVMLQRTSHHEFDEVLFVLGNDLVNSDNKTGQTFSGTPVDNDSRYWKTYRVVLACMIATIERLRSRAKRIRVIVVPGNHDAQTSLHLGHALECYFNKYEDVSIDNDPRTFKYHQFGKVGLMFTHGHKGKKDALPLKMAQDVRKMWAETRFNEVHTGHLHQDWVREFQGVKVRVLSALCPPDAYHADEGYTGNLQSAEAYVWSREEGLIQTALYTETN